MNLLRFVFKLIYNMAMKWKVLIFMYIGPQANNIYVVLKVKLYKFFCCLNVALRFREELTV